MLSNTSPVKKIRLVITLGLVVIVAMGWVSYQSTTELFKSFGWVYHTHQVIEKIGVLTNQLTDIQQATRGYVITGDEKYLGPYYGCLPLIPESLTEVTNLTQDNPVQRQNLMVLKPQIDTFMGIYARVVKLRRTMTEEKITKIIKKGTGLNAMNAIMKTIDGMNDEENRLLVLRDAEENRTERNTRWTIFIVTLVAALAIIGAGLDIQRQIKLENRLNQKLKEKDAVIFQFLDGLPLGVFVAEADGKPYYANKIGLNLLGRGLMPSNPGTLAEKYQTYVTGTDQLYPLEKMTITRALKGERTSQDDMEIRQPNGTGVPIEVWGTPIFDGEGQLTHALSAFMDISERKKYQAELKNLSVHDELTGLYNRRGFMTLSEQQLKIVARAKAALLVLFIDLDGLKRVNDSLGHQAGDEMIKEFARIILGHFRKTDLVARMGGDEFAAMTTDKPHESNAMIQRLPEKVEARNAVNGNSYRLDFSVGSAVYDPAHPCDMEKLISEADQQMYAEKQKKKNNPRLI